MAKNSTVPDKEHPVLCQGLKSWVFFTDDIEHHQQVTLFCILLILPSAYSLTPACAINGVDQRGRRGALDTPFLDSLPSM